MLDIIKKSIILYIMKLKESIVISFALLSGSTAFSQGTEKATKLWEGILNKVEYVIDETEEAASTIFNIDTYEGDTKESSTLVNSEQLKNNNLKKYPFSKSQKTESILKRIDVPSGYSRIIDNSGFSEWLRNLPLKPDGTEVMTYDGTEATLSERFFMSNAGVIDMDIMGQYQQCADVILRLNAEYHRSKNESVTLPGGKSISGKSSRKDFNKFLRESFATLGTASMKRDMKKVNENDLKIGDVNVQNTTGAVGHIFIILDIVENNKGEKLYLMGQGGTPAQNFHIMESPVPIIWGNTSGPWWSMEDLQNILEKFSPHGKGVFRRF